MHCELGARPRSSVTSSERLKTSRPPFSQSVQCKSQAWSKVPIAQSSLDRVQTELKSISGRSCCLLDRRPRRMSASEHPCWIVLEMTGGENRHLKRQKAIPQTRATQPHCQRYRPVMPTKKLSLSQISMQGQPEHFTITAVSFSNRAR